MQVIAVVALAVLSVFVIVELVWARGNARRVHDMRDSLGNLVHLIGGQLVKPLSIAWSFAVYGWVAPLQVFQLPHTAWAFALTFIVVDCAYYWYHRLSHQTPFLWALHHTHHSSPWLNLTTAVRLNWLARFVTPLFFTPLVLLYQGWSIYVFRKRLGVQHIPDDSPVVTAAEALTKAAANTAS